MQHTHMEREAYKRRGGLERANYRGSEKADEKGSIRPTAHAVRRLAVPKVRNSFVKSIYYIWVIVVYSHSVPLVHFVCLSLYM